MLCNRATDTCSYDVFSPTPISTFVFLCYLLLALAKSLQSLCDHVSQVAFAGHLNNLLQHDEFLASMGYLPMGQLGNSLFEAIRDGVVLWYVSPQG